jgi:hypothetical protein
MGGAVKALLLCAGAFATGAVVAVVVIGVTALKSFADATSEGASFYETLDSWWEDDLFDEYTD